MSLETTASASSALRSVARLTRGDYYPIAFLARLPFAMTIVGVLALVVQVRGSVAEGGIASAAAGVATAVLGPLLGAQADRRGQRVVLLACSAASVLAMVALVTLVYARAPLAAVVGAAALVGGLAPQVGPFSRSRMVGAAAPAGPRAVSVVMSVESVADEASFVLGPVLVGVLATLVGSWAPFAVAAALVAVFSVAFALHPSAVRGVPGPLGRVRPVERALPLRVLVLVLAMGLVGGIFGATLTALTGFLEDRGAAAQAGTVYGAMSVGSIVFALGVAALPARFSLLLRWLVFGVVATGGLVLLALASGTIGAAGALVVAGCGIGAVLVTLFSMGSSAAPPGRTTTVLTTLQSSLTVGQALVLAATGAIVEAQGAPAGYLVAVALAAALTVLAVCSIVVGRRR